MGSPKQTQFDRRYARYRSQPVAGTGPPFLAAAILASLPSTINGSHGRQLPTCLLEIMQGISFPNNEGAPDRLNTLQS